ncbi:MAG TPA: response regulator [Bacteroidota bacterium]
MAHTASEKPKHASKGRIFIMDDDTSLVQLLKIALESRGYEVEASASVEGLRSSVMRFRPDVLLLDVYLGSGKNGLELLEEIKKERSTKQLPVIVMTGFPSSATAVQAIKTQAEDYFEKPLDFDRLLEVIEEIKSRKKQDH